MHLVKTSPISRAERRAAAQFEEPRAHFVLDDTATAVGTGSIQLIGGTFITNDALYSNVSSNVLGFTVIATPERATVVLAITALPAALGL